MKISGLDATVLESNKNPKKLAVLMPGYLDTKNYNHIKLLEKDLNKIGYTTISFDPTGIWESDGKVEQYNFTQYLKDIETIINFAKNKNKFDEIILIGHSFGGRIALYYASMHPEISAVIVLMSALKSYHSKDKLSIWKKAGLRFSKRDLPENPKKFREFVTSYSSEFNRSKCDISKIVKKYQNPLLVLAAELDKVTNPKYVKQLYDFANEPKEFKIIKEIGHDYRHNKKDVKIVNDAIIHFLDRLNKTIIVDENNNIIGSKPRMSIQKDDIYRVSGLWITNSKEDVLLAQRKFTKKNDPGKWGPAVAGTVEEGENYKDNIIKEAFEELGLKNIKPIEGPIRRHVGKHNYFSQRFYLKIDKKICDFKIAKDEVEQIKWFSRDELQKLIKEKPEMFLASLPSWIGEFKDF